MRHRETSPRYGVRAAGADACAAEEPMIGEGPLRLVPARKLLDQVRDALRLRHRSPRTEHAYVGWIRRFIVFHEKRHPREMGAAEIERFLSSLAVDRNVAASTQNQALAALLFLYREVLGIEVPWLEGIVRGRTRMFRKTPRACGARNVGRSCR